MKAYRSILLLHEDTPECYFSYVIVRDWQLADSVYLFHLGSEAIDFIKLNWQQTYTNGIIEHYFPILILFDLDAVVEDLYETLESITTISFVQDKVTFIKNKMIRICLLSTPSNPLVNKLTNLYNTNFDVIIIEKPLTYHQLLY